MPNSAAMPAPVLGLSAGSAVGGLGGYGTLPSVATASQDTIDPSIMAQHKTNDTTQEFIWSPQDATLYELHNNRGITMANQPGAIKLIFPPGTMLLAWEKDGTLASPAFRPLHPHSNQW